MPVAPPGTVPTTINANAIIWAKANSTVRAVLWSHRAQYKVANIQLKYVDDINARCLVNRVLKKAINPDRKQKLNMKNKLPRE